MGMNFNKGPFGGHHLGGGFTICWLLSGAGFAGLMMLPSKSPPLSGGLYWETTDSIF